ncbi:MAG: DUF2095 family protein [Crenarchaeota archaeon]|nr:DUF2095 family protein [Thermoproteota archaeon]
MGTLERKKDLKKMFPNLIKELEGSENKVKIDSIRKDSHEAEIEATNQPITNNNSKKSIEDKQKCSQVETNSLESSDKFLHYNPSIIDFIRRCDTDAQAEEIILYMSKKGEISKEYSCQLRNQLKKEGVRSFGPKKESDYYFKESGLY